MDYAQQAKIYGYVVATLRELGVTNPRLEASNTRVLCKDGCYAGQVAECEHVRVFFSVEGQRIHFLGPADVLLKEVDVEQIAA